MGRMKDYLIGLQEIYPELSDQELINNQRRLDDYVEDCIEQDCEGGLND